MTVIRATGGRRAATFAGRLVAGRLGGAAATILVALLLASAPALATGPRPQGASFPMDRTVTLEPPSAADQGMRSDRRARVFSATGYQTLLLAGVIGGAAVVGAIAGGVHPALVAGAAVFAVYLFMP